MAREIYEEKAQTRILELSKKETTDLIGLLVAQLAGVALTGNMAGSVPTIVVEEKGVVKYRLCLVAK